MMKSNKKSRSLLGLVLALTLIVGCLATSALAADSKVGSTISSLTSDDLALGFAVEQAISIKGSKEVNNTGNDLVQIVGDQTFDEYKVIDINDLNHDDAAKILENAQPMEITLISVSHNDERKFTPEEWSQILELIDEGKVSWED